MSSRCQTRKAEARKDGGGARKRATAGFTLIEVIMASAIFTMLLVLGLSVFGQASGTWRRTDARVKAFQSARLGFDLLTRQLRQATLNTYMDYFDTNNRTLASYGSSIPATFVPARYGRESQLQFVSAPAGVASPWGPTMPGTPNTGTAVFFQAPLGHTDAHESYGKLTKTLNTCGYFVKFDTDKPWLPAFTQQGGAAAGKYRYRLMGLVAPTEKNTIFGGANAGDLQWFTGPATNAQPVGENIIALIVHPEDPENPALLTGYTYNSKDGANGVDGNGNQPVTANQLPPIMKVTLIAIDEASARRIENGTSEPPVIAGALAGRFLDGTKYEEDLAAVTTVLAAQRIQYRVFQTAVPILETKWSK